MPNPNTKKVECDLEGRKGQAVEFRSKLKWKYHRRSIRLGSVVARLQAHEGDPDVKLLNDLDEAMDQIEDTLAYAIVDWDWTDEKGKKLPLPSKDIEVLGDLMQEEIMWLNNNVSSGGESEEEAKNAESP